MNDPKNGLPPGSLDGLERFGEGLSLDEGIRHFVLILLSQGIETYQSCEGGPGHSYTEPTIEFHGDAAEGPRAAAAALNYGLPVAELRRVWSLYRGEIDGPHWAMTFRMKAKTHLKARSDHEARWFEQKRTGLRS